MINLPNSLTLLRILLVPLFVILIIYKNLNAALIVFILAALTDGLDGFIARLFNQKTTLGSFLDPVADKALVITAYLTLTIGKILPVWLTVIVISRDIVILVGFALIFLLVKNKVLYVRPSFLSKITTFFQLLTILLALLFLSKEPWYLSYIFFLTATLTISSGLDYIYKGFKLIET